MKFAESELRQITTETWRILTGEELESSAGDIDLDDINDPIAACAQISGDWHLAVTLYCSSILARRAAVHMFSTDESNATMDEIHDAMCELVNIIAGNIKGTLSGSSHLSLPNLVRGSNFKLMFPRHVLFSKVAFSCAGEPLLVLLLAEDKAVAARDGRSAALPTGTAS